jgi:hypothetical protein
LKYNILALVGTAKKGGKGQTGVQNCRSLIVWAAFNNYGANIMLRVQAQVILISYVDCALEGKVTICLEQILLYVEGFKKF